MLLIKFALRRILCNWRLYLVCLFGISLISGLLAGLPEYSKTIAYHSLRRSIEKGHPIERNVEVSGSTSILTAGMWGYVNEIIGDLIIERVVVRTTTLGVDVRNPEISIGSTIGLELNYINVLSLDKLSRFSKLVEGKWPEYRPPYTQEEIRRAMTKPPDIEAAIGLNASKETGVKIGDIIVDNSGRHFPIVGIVEPIDPNDDVWWGDMTVLNVYRRPGLNEDTTYLSLIVHQNNLSEYYPEHGTSWRILINHELFTPENIQTIEQRLIMVKSGIGTYKASLQTNLPNLLEKYREDINTTYTIVLLLSMQSLIFMVYGLYLIESLILEKAQAEFSTMVSRGSGIHQLVIIMGTEGLIVALIAGAVTGPLMASSLLFIWSNLTGSNMFEWRIDSDVSLGLSMVGAGIGWLVLLIGTLIISRRNVVSWQKSQSRHEGKLIWQKYYIDLFMIAFSGLTYWQLSFTGSFLFQRIKDTDLADPLLLISPTIFLLSISLILLRIYPFLLSLSSRIVHTIRGIILPMSIKKLSRDPLKPSQMILLISIASSVTLFSNSYDYSLMVNQENISQYISGADIRIKKYDLSVDEIAKLPGILNITQVFRHVAQMRTGKTVTILGIEPSVFPNVTYYPSGMTNITIKTIANVLEFDGKSMDDDQTELTFEADFHDQSNDKVNSIATFPAIFSYSAIPPNLGIGDNQEYTILTTPVNFNIRGLIKNFPTIEGRYIVTDLTRLAEFVNLGRSEYYADFELWLSVDPEKYSEIISIPFVQEYLISDAQQELRTIRENAYAEGAIGAFRLNTFILSIMSITIFSLLTYSSARNRNYEFGILRAEGLSLAQLIFILLTEGIISIIVGISIGTIIGIGLSHVMRPFINVALMRSFPQMVVYKLFFNWSQITSSYGVLILCYLISLIIATQWLIRVGIHQLMRIGDE